MLNNRDRLSIT